MALPNLTFSVASEYDGKGLGKARKDVNAFSKNIKNLARTVGVSLSAAALVQFGKASVKAFSDAQREGVVLANTMRNLELAFATPQVEAYINSIGKLYGVTGEQAVPAMQSLLSATGSVTKSQQLMNTALNISAQTGIDVTSVAKGLSQAYLGNRKALSQYNTGLSKAELQLISFSDLQLRLDKIFAGSATDAAATYSGQMIILAENAETAKEVIGKGLVDSFVLLAGEGSLPSATSAMQDFADATAEATVGAASLIDKLQQKLSPGGFNFLGLIPVIGGYIGPGGVLDKLREEGRKVAAQNMGAPGAISGKSLTGAAYFAAQEKAEKKAEATAKRIAKIEKDRLANIKKIAAEAAKKLALDKLSAVLNQANKLFDMDRIQLAAAAMSKQTEEDRVRIRLKTNILELEDAINEGNVQSAAKFASLITQDAALLGQLRGLMVGLGDIPNPFSEWLTTLEKMLAVLMALPMVKPVTTYTPNFQPFTPAPGGYEGFGSGLSDMGLGNYGGLAGAGRYGGGGAPVINVVVNNAGSTITERDLVDTITQGIYNNQAAGIPINYSTVY
jgi:hypothetical protein